MERSVRSKIQAIKSDANKFSKVDKLHSLVNFLRDNRRRIAPCPSDKRV